MKSAEQWLAEYDMAHQNPLNQRIHAIAVPLIFWSLLAALATLPPLALLLLTPLFTFYFSLGWRPGFMIVLITWVSLMTAYLMRIWGLPVPYIAAAIFISAWTAQFYGHKVEGKKPAFLTDLFFLLVGPLWTLKKCGLLSPPKD